jgi:hypothetical protein
VHGQFPRGLDEKLVGREQSYRWLKFEDMNGGTGSTVVAVQYELLKERILKEEIESKWQLCQEL